MTDAAAELPAAAAQVFGAGLPLAQRYAGRLATDGVERGLLGPRETGRLWDRHLLNSAVLTDLVPVGARVVDVGTGAGLPGVVMAIRRPDLRVDLVEPMQRRVEFLIETVDELGLGDRIRVVRGRADDAETVRRVGGADWVVARAVAPLDRLVRWCLPLLSARGRLLALKGAGVAAEAQQHAVALRRSGAQVASIEQLGDGVLMQCTWVAVVTRRPAKAKGLRGVT
ncbi:MAG: rRNA (guanine527-N7)-methyltransferase [Pseudonocardiales bacterium]|nr:rRNA (guanine527-N7)-methyltransferase [Pseudonocardiales bacterium]